MHLVALTAVLVLASPQASLAATAPPTPAPRASAPGVPTPGMVARAALAPRAAGMPSDEAERVVITTQDKLSLVGSYLAPRSKDASPGALLIHDAGGRRADLDDYAARLNKVGFAVLILDLRGHGDSATSELAWDKLDRKGRETLWAFATRDLKAGVDYLTGRREVHSSSLVLIGHRSGATLVARHAVRDENVRAIALLDPPSDDKDMYGFQLAKDIEDLGGLPTYISAPRGSREQAQRMAEDGKRANSGLDFIQVSIFPGEAPDLLHDMREAADVAKYLKDRAAPNKRSR